MDLGGLGEVFGVSAFAGFDAAGCFDYFHAGEGRSTCGVSGYIIAVL